MPVIENEWNREAIALQEAHARRRYVESTDERNLNISKMKDGNLLGVDDQKRVDKRVNTINPRDGMSYERLIGKSDLFPISYLEAGLRAGKSVCRIEIRDSMGRVLGYGTGFLVSPSLLMTNNHVLDKKETALHSLAQFDHETDLNLMPRPIKNFRIDPNRFFMTDTDLDFTLVAVEMVSAEGITLREFGFLPFLPESGKIILGEYASCIEHPGGSPKAVVVRENQFVTLLPNFVHYRTDTDRGASGSPIFSDDWMVVALHHMGVRDENDPEKFVANEGVRISSIAHRIDELKPGAGASAQIYLKELYASAEAIQASVSGAPAMEVSTQDREWYDTSTGYNPRFLGDDNVVPLPKVRSDMESDILTLKDGGSVLNYTHFSLVMSRSRKLAFFTAVNIDGSQLTTIKRTKDVWYYDPRIEKSDQYGPELYASNDLDRGHLVRRMDPIWGENAKEAGEDTFHFTNCSPQHKKLNQVTWENLEDYILKNAGSYGLKVNVFTGPVFRADDLVYRGQYRIPADFYKVVVMVKDDGKLSATAYLQTQKNLIDNLEFAYGEYETYQVPVATIEDLTGLDFGDLRKSDPLATIESTAGRIISRAEDIRI